MVSLKILISNMLVSFEYKFIFLKTFKTASTSTEIYFEQYCSDHEREERTISEMISEKGIIGARNSEIKNNVNFYNHMTAFEIKNKLDKNKFDEYYKFCNVRNPFDLLVSNYYFFEKYRNIRFDRFINNEIILNEIKDGICDIFTINSEIILNDFIRYEYLNDDIKKISEKLNLPITKRQIGHYVKSKSRDNYDYLNLFDTQSKLKIERVFKDYFSYFGY
jgi:hypothetical protein